MEQVDDKAESYESKAVGGISAIVPVYNVEKYLVRCVSSLLRQTLPIDEIILVDDGSTDRSGSICDSLSREHPSIRVIHKENGGLSSARNIGIAACRGEYIVFVDSDDWVSSQYTEILYSLIQEYDADIAKCQSVRARDVNTKVGLPEGRHVHLYTGREYTQFFFRVKSNRCVHYACDKMYRREILTSDQYPIGMLNEDVEGSYKAFLKAKTIVETSDVLYFYFINSNGITGSGFGQNYLVLPNNWERVVEYTQKEFPEFLDLATYNLKRTDFTVLCDSILHGNQETDQKYSAELKDMRIRLKKNLRSLLRGPMTVDRKIACISITYFFPAVRFIYRAVGKKIYKKA